MDIFRLDGDVALVTGAGSGIGQRLAIGLAEAGAAVACVDLKSREQGLKQTVGAINASGRSAKIYCADVTSEHDIGQAVEQLEKSLGALTVAINCAGIANACPAEEMPAAQWQAMLDTNLTGLFLCCQAEARVMLPRLNGRIINIASMSGSIVNRGLQQAHYNSSKAGVIQLTKSLAMEWVDRGLRVNAISPGYTASPMNTRPEVAAQVKQFEDATPMARMANVDELVGPAVFLASSASSYCTGIDLLVDGGFSCW